ncbi:SoxR reducing system RseC family protein [Marinobacter halophilus]|uniref:Sigma E positive regulator RseC/MucC n=1 Tax=Marinobacter halophilus TaxID=1323740 RepID=A0A2T1KD07_9GAMM|nr:SoxR reducing system RseC family protein [Marinobacter halophilus]PSF07432.1 sigma E positive regulator RseC/MucC [Marinobacter halophilus]GGC81027.1 SoxR reducing system protein RseC [Marinobacter halophilus]
MITETGKVVALKDDNAWVQTIRASACQSCSARSGCGQRALAKVSGGRANQVLVANTAGAKVGDEVLIGIDEQSLLTASLAVYGLPLVLMVVASIASHRWFGGTDAVAISGALVGLGLGFWWARRWQSGKGDRYRPRMLRVNSSYSVTCL